jgi:hypothetical protein
VTGTKTLVRNKINKLIYGGKMQRFLALNLTVCTYRSCLLLCFEVLLYSFWEDGK